MMIIMIIIMRIMSTFANLLPLAASKFNEFSVDGEAMSVSSWKIFGSTNRKLKFQEMFPFLFPRNEGNVKILRIGLKQVFPTTLLHTRSEKNFLFLIESEKFNGGGSVTSRNLIAIA